jgi:hypothetical protein
MYPNIRARKNCHEGGESTLLGLEAEERRKAFMSSIGTQQGLHKNTCKMGDSNLHSKSILEKGPLALPSLLIATMVGKLLKSWPTREEDPVYLYLLPPMASSFPLVKQVTTLRISLDPRNWLCL